MPFAMAALDVSEAQHHPHHSMAQGTKNNLGPGGHETTRRSRAVTVIKSMQDVMGPMRLHDQIDAKCPPINESVVVSTQLALWIQASSVSIRDVVVSMQSVLRIDARHSWYRCKTFPRIDQDVLRINESVVVSMQDVGGYIEARAFYRGKTSSYRCKTSLSRTTSSYRCERDIGSWDRSKTSLSQSSVVLSMQASVKIRIQDVGESGARHHRNQCRHHQSDARRHRGISRWHDGPDTKNKTFWRGTRRRPPVSPDDPASGRPTPVPSH